MNKLKRIKRKSFLINMILMTTGKNSKKSMKIGISMIADKKCFIMRRIRKSF